MQDECDVKLIINILLLLLLLLTAIGLMPGGSVYKDHTFNKETAHLTYTAQYIARIFTVQYKYMNIHSTVHYISISTIQVLEHYKTQETENYRKNTDNTRKEHREYEKTQQVRIRTEAVVIRYPECCFSLSI
jgi:hypothetical protein